MSPQFSVSSVTSRADMVKRGRKLEYFTIAYNSLEGLIAIVAGLFAGSIALIGFGFDSVIEVTSGGMLLWRLYADVNESLRERAERLSLRIVGCCFLALALYISYDSIALLVRQRAPERSVPGIVLALASLIAMPLLARAKRKVARDMGSAAMKADARQTEFCTWLSAILLGGLVLNAFLGWWWADPAAGLVMHRLLPGKAWKDSAATPAAPATYVIEADEEQPEDAVSAEELMFA